MALTLNSPAFPHQGDIPRQYTCQGDDISPALQWDSLPIGAQSLVLIVDDPDAPDPAAPRTVWAHWLLYNLPAQSRGLPEDVRPADLPPGTLQGLNDWNRTGYGGPCPPIGRHRYFFKLYALDIALKDLHTPNKSTLEKALQGHVLEQADWIGMYQQS